MSDNQKNDQKGNQMKVGVRERCPACDPEKGCVIMKNVPDPGSGRTGDMGSRCQRFWPRNFENK